MEINGGPVEYRIGPLTRPLDSELNENDTLASRFMMGLYVEFYQHREFQPYRGAVRGYYKDYLSGGNFWTWAFQSDNGYRFTDKYGKEAVNFHDVEKIMQPGIYSLDPQKDALVQAAVQRLEKWTIDGKALSEIIDSVLKQGDG